MNKLIIPRYINQTRWSLSTIQLTNQQRSCNGISISCQFVFVVLLPCYNLICKDLIKLLGKKNFYQFQVCDSLQYKKGGEMNYATCFFFSKFNILILSKSWNCQPPSYYTILIINLGDKNQAKNEVHQSMKKYRIWNWILGSGSNIRIKVNTVWILVMFQWNW